MTTGKKKFICSVCKNGFTRKHYLKIHIEKQHNLKEPTDEQKSSKLLRQRDLCVSNIIVLVHMLASIEKLNQWDDRVLSSGTVSMENVLFDFKTDLIEEIVSESGSLAKTIE